MGKSSDFLTPFKVTPSPGVVVSCGPATMPLRPERAIKITILLNLLDWTMTLGDLGDRVEDEAGRGASIGGIQCFVPAVRGGE